MKLLTEDLSYLFKEDVKGKTIRQMFIGMKEIRDIILEEDFSDEEVFFNITQLSQLFLVYVLHVKHLIWSDDSLSTLEKDVKFAELVAGDAYDIYSQIISKSKYFRWVAFGVGKDDSGEKINRRDEFCFFNTDNKRQIGYRQKDSEFENIEYIYKTIEEVRRDFFKIDWDKGFMEISEEIEQLYKNPIFFINTDLPISEEFLLLIRKKIKHSVKAYQEQVKKAGKNLSEKLYNVFYRMSMNKLHDRWRSLRISVHTRGWGNFSMSEINKNLDDFFYDLIRQPK